MAGQVLRMNGNGRLTAPPQVEVVLVTNSVDGMVSEGRGCGPETGGIALARFSPRADNGNGVGTPAQRDKRRVRCAGGGRITRNARSLWNLRSFRNLRKPDTVSATHGLSVSQGGAAKS